MSYTCAIGLFLGVTFHHLVGVAMTGATPWTCREYCETTLPSQQRENSEFINCKCSERRRLLRSLSDISTISSESNIYYEPVDYDVSHKPGPFDTFAMKNPIRNNIHVKELNSRVNHNEDEVPLYLDLGFVKSDEKQFRDADELVIENLDTTHNNLIECLDLHIFIISRKQMDSAPGMLRPEQLIFYEQISDNDLADIVRKKCNHLETILKNSLHSIQEAQPTKSKVIMADGDNTMNTAFSNDKGDTVSLSLENKDVEKYVISNSTNRPIISLNTTKEKYHKHSAENEVDFLSKNFTQSVRSQETDTDTNKKSDEISDLNNSSLSDENDITPNGPQEQYNDSEEMKGMLVQHDDTSSLIPILTTEENMSTSTKFSENYKESQSANNTSETYYVSTTEISIPYDVQHIPSTEVSLVIPNTENNANRPVVSLNEIHLPSIETKELENGTAKSEITGFEDFETHNSDFIYNTSSEEPLVPEVKGKIYLRFNNSDLPAHFIQKPDGIHIGITGYSLCKEIKASKRSVILSALCKNYEN